MTVDEGLSTYQAAQGVALRADWLLDSMAIGTLADALHLLARAGRVVIVRESGLRVIARFADAC